MESSNRVKNCFAWYKFDDTASADEKRTLLRAVRDLGSDAAAIIPKSMEIDFVEVSGGQGNSVFGAMTEYLDKQMSKAIIGQTMTTDEGSSLSQSETHNDVRGDITASDARQLTTTINRDLIARYMAYNHPNAAHPSVKFPYEDPEDLTLLANTLGQLVPLGFRVAQSDVSSRMGFRVPDDGEPVLAPSVQEVIPPKSNKAARQARCASCGEVHFASSQPDDEDHLVVEALDNWEEDMTPIVAGVVAVAQSSANFSEFLTNLDEHTPDVARLGKRLAAQMMKAKGDGLSDA